MTVLDAQSVEPADYKNLTQVTAFPSYSNVITLAFSSDDTVMAGVTQDRILLWGPQGNLLHQLAIEQPKGDILRPANKITFTGAFVFSTDNKNLYAAASDFTIRMWKVESGEFLKTLTGHQRLVRALKFSPDGRVLTSSGEDKTVKLWDGATGNPLGQLLGHVFDIVSIAFSEDGKYFYSRGSTPGANVAEVKKGSTETGKVAEEFTTKDQLDPNTTIFLANGDIIAHVGHDVVAIRDGATGNLIRTIQAKLFQYRIQRMTFSNDSSAVA